MACDALSWLTGLKCTLPKSTMVTFSEAAAIDYGSEMAAECENGHVIEGMDVQNHTYTCLANGTFGVEEIVCIGR